MQDPVPSVDLTKDGKAAHIEFQNISMSWLFFIYCVRKGETRAGTQKKLKSSMKAVCCPFGSGKNIPKWNIFVKFKASSKPTKKFSVSGNVSMWSKEGRGNPTRVRNMISPKRPPNPIWFCLGNGDGESIKVLSNMLNELMFFQSGLCDWHLGLKIKWMLDGVSCFCASYLVKFWE